MIPSAHLNFVVTSQYTINEIFGSDQETVEALRRRFIVHHMVFKSCAAAPFIIPKRQIEGTEIATDIVDAGVLNGE